MSLKIALMTGKKHDLVTKISRLSFFFYNETSTKWIDLGFMT